MARFLTRNTQRKGYVRAGNDFFIQEVRFHVGCDFARRSLGANRLAKRSHTETLLLTRPSTSAWLSDPRANVGRT
eukprot:scaffold137894_cov169-Phaeocystis_antarctica.AAC.1